MPPNKHDNEGTVLPENYIHVPPINVDIPKFREFIFEQMKTYSTRIAQIDSVTGRKETYGSLLSRCIRTAQTMQMNGIAKGDIVSLCSLNNMDYTVPTIASLFIGALITPVDPTAPLSEIIYCLKLVIPKIIFCETESVNKIRSALKQSGLQCEIVLFGETQNHTPFSKYLIPRGTEEEFNPVATEDLRETALIMFSSGTSGLPKAICVNQFALSNYIVNNRILMSDQNVLMTVSNPYWISNVLFLIQAISSASPRIMCRAFDANTAIKLIQDYKVNIAFFTTTNSNHFIQNPATCNYDTSKLKCYFIGGTPVTYCQILELMKLFPYSDFYNCYGMTEIAGSVLKKKKQDKEALLNLKRSCLGIPVPGFYYKVVDPDTERILGPNEPGEIRVKSDAVMTGYYQQANLTNEAFDYEGYIKSGDIVFYDEKYNFYCVDRIKDVIKYKSLHLSPTLIEMELLKHPDVKECAVVGTPDEMDDEVPTGVVVLHENCTTTPEDIVKYFNDRVSDRYRLRGGVVIVDKLPYTGTEKLKRKQLKDVVAKIKSTLV